MLIERHIDLFNFEDARLVPQPHPARVRRDAREHLHFSPAPIRVDVTGRKDRDQNGDLRNLLDQRVGEVLVPLKPRIAPDRRLRAEVHLQLSLKCLMEDIYPATLTFDQRLIVVVRVTNEDVVFVIGKKTHSQPPKTADAKGVAVLRFYITGRRDVSASAGNREPK